MLKVRVGEEIAADVGSLGSITFETGWYGYVGSSRTTDFTRIERHAKLDRGENQTRHWHIDYLLGSDNSKLIGSYRTNSDVECPISNSISLDSIEDFGCSDCDCGSHLYFAENETDFDNAVSDSFQQLNEKFEYILAED